MSGLVFTATAGTPALRTSGRWARLPAIHAFRRSAGPLGPRMSVEAGRGVRPLPSRRSTVLHHHYAFDNTGPRGACKSVLSSRRLAHRERDVHPLRTAHDLQRVNI